MKNTKVLHGELGLKGGDGPVKKHARGCCQYNVVGVEERVDGVGPTAENE